MAIDEGRAEYVVVVNDEGQYSIWPARRSIPRGWRNVGKPGTKAGCLNYISEAWTDMRPLSLRRTMDGEQQQHST
jgi:MbtH protein